MNSAKESPNDKMQESGSRALRILVVDDNEGIRSYLASLLEIKGYQVDTAGDGRSALHLLDSGASPDVIILDIMMPGIDGLETLRRMREMGDETPLIMLSVVGKASSIVEAMNLGAMDYLNKPFEEEELEATLESVLEKHGLKEERNALLKQLSEPDKAAVWLNPAMCKIQHVVNQISNTDVTVLIQGESGVGKEVVAHLVHTSSNRKDAPFIKVNCAALPSELLESELFGYEKGAFTGAMGRKQGKFEAAEGGTIFLDEIGETSPRLQAKLLHVLQDRTFSRVGGNREIHADVRIVCATNRRLEQMVRDGEFREDLFFRLNVVSILIPPLRDRREEMEPLCDLFLRRYSALYERPIARLSDLLVSAFERYPFPGNIRQLENMIKRIIVLGNEASILEEVMGGGMTGSGGATATDSGALEEILERAEANAGTVPLKEVGRQAALEAERQVIEQVLYHTSWNRKQASKILNVSYKTLLHKIRESGLEGE
jgi:DNA-binding NtrC family response regulator